MTRLSQSQAEGFYAVHRERPFFCQPCQVHDRRPGDSDGAFEREDAVKGLRGSHGATNPANAVAAGTIRKLFAESIERNTIHGSDAPETAAQELAYFFNSIELRQL